MSDTRMTLEKLNNAEERIMARKPYKGTRFMIRADEVLYLIRECRTLIQEKEALESRLDVEKFMGGALDDEHTVTCTFCGKTETVCGEPDELPLLWEQILEDADGEHAYHVVACPDCQPAGGNAQSDH